MALIQKGLLGHVSGSLASITGYKRNGKSIIQSKVNKASTVYSPVFISQSEKLRLANEQYNLYSTGITSILSKVGISQYDQRDRIVKHYFTNLNTLYPSGMFNVLISPQGLIPSIRSEVFLNEIQKRIGVRLFNLVDAKTSGIAHDVGFVTYRSSSNSSNVIYTPITVDSVAYQLSYNNVFLPDYVIRGSIVANNVDRSICYLALTCYHDS
jgi:hypothetical protein